MRLFVSEKKFYFQVSSLASSLMHYFIIINVLFGWQVICMVNDYRL